MSLPTIAILATGGTKGQALQIVKSQGAYTFTFQDFRFAPGPTTGRIDGDKLTFESSILGLTVRFAGTITPQEIRGRISNSENDSRFTMDVRLPLKPLSTPMPNC